MDDPLPVPGDSFRDKGEKVGLIFRVEASFSYLGKFKPTRAVLLLQYLVVCSVTMGRGMNVSNEAMKVEIMEINYSREVMHEKINKKMMDGVTHLIEHQIVRLSCIKSRELQIMM